MKPESGKRFFTRHAKSSAALISAGIHAVLLVVALSFVAVSVIQKDDQTFKAQSVKRPRMQLKKLQVPIDIKKKRTQKPKLRKRVLVKDSIKTPEIKMPEISGVKGGLGSGYGRDGGGSGIGFSMPEIDFFGARGKAEKVVFIVHFGPATIGNNPYQRMTGYTIRKRLEDLINELPAVSLFNVAAYWASDTVAMSPDMMLASPANKQKVIDWMKPVNPLQGNYEHCFVWKQAAGKVSGARSRYPSRITGLPFYSPKWIYPYEVPGKINSRYLGQDKKFMHWNRGVTWALQTQKPDTIFILTTNYIDAWGTGPKGNPVQLSDAYKKMIRDVYGPDRHRWPTLNIVVLRHGNANPDTVLNSQFGPIIKAFQGNGSVIRDISNYMTNEERAMYKEFRAQYK
jgi:hypothetical protein